MVREEARPMTVLEEYEARDYFKFLDANYQQALRKSGKGWASKSLGPIFVLALCFAALVACPFVIYGIVKNCYYPEEKDKSEEEENSEDYFGVRSTTVETTVETPTKCSTAFGAGLIVAVVAGGLLSIVLGFFCHRIYKRYAAEEYKVHSGAAKFRVDERDRPATSHSFVISIPNSYHMYFLKEDNMTRNLEDIQTECVKNIVNNCWFEPEVTNENRAEVNDVHLSEYLYAIQNPLLWQKYQDFIVSRRNLGDAGGYINLDCLGSDLDGKSILTHQYIHDLEKAFPSTWNQAVPRFTEKEGLFFMTMDVNEIIPTLNKGLKFTKGPLGKAVYLYDNIKTAIEKPKHEMFCEPKCLLLVRAHIESLCTLTTRPRNTRKYGAAVVEGRGHEGGYGREFAFFDANMCMPLILAIYRRKFTKEVKKTREAVFKMIAEGGCDV